MSAPLGPRARGVLRTRRTRVVLVAVLVLALLSGGIAWWVTADEESVGPSAEAFRGSAAVTAEGVRLELPGVTVTAGPGVAPVGTVLTAGPAGPAPGDSPLDGYVAPPSSGVELGLSEGRQPQQPVTLVFHDVAPPDHDRGDSDVPAVVSRPADGGAPVLLAADWDGATRELTVTTDHFSWFWPSWLDIGRWAGQLRTFANESLGIRTPRPSCAGATTTLAGGTVAVTGTLVDAATPPAWTCVGTDGGRATLTLTSNSGFPWQVRVQDLTPPHSYQPGTVQDAAARAFHDAVIAAREPGADGLLLPTGGITYTLARGELPRLVQLVPDYTMQTIRTLTWGLLGSLSVFGIDAGRLGALGDFYDCVLAVEQSRGPAVRSVSGVAGVARAVIGCFATATAQLAQPTRLLGAFLGLAANGVGLIGGYLQEAGTMISGQEDLRATVSRTPGCGVDLASPAVTEAAGRLPVLVPDDPGYEWAPEYAEGTFDPCVTLSAVHVTIRGATGSSPQHVLLFHRGEYVGTATTEAYASSVVDAAASTDDTVVVVYSYLRPWDQSNAGASGRAVVRYRWNGSAVERLDELPQDLVEPAQDALVSLDGFGPFPWGEDRSDAESLLGNDLTLTDLGAGCAQGQLDWLFSPTFAVQDGLVSAAAVYDEGVVTDTGIRVGDPVSEVLAAYPDAQVAPDPSDAFSTRYEYSAGGRTAQFTSSDGATVSSMQFGLADSVGEAPCV